MNNYAIHSLTREDASSLMRLQHQSTGTLWTLEAAYKILEDVAMKGWGVHIEGTLVGFILIQLAGESADIVEFVVEESYRHQGFGKKLYNAMENYGADHGLKELFLEVSAVNMSGHLFYQKRGFKAVGLRQDYYISSKGKVDAILMRKQLD